MAALLQTRGRNWIQESYETGDAAIKKRAAELRKQGYRVTSSSMGNQVTQWGKVKMTLLDIRPGTSGDEYLERVNPKRNPLEAAEELSEAWHGRPAEKVTVLDEELHVHSKLVDLGGMECLEICDPRSERYVIPVKFGHDVRLCSSEDGLSLYLLGGDQHVDVKPFGIEMDKDLVVLGKAHAVTYFTSKQHLGKADKVPGPYRHVFGEETNGERPTILYDCQNHLVLFAGGVYHIDRDMDFGKHSAGLRD